MSAERAGEAADQTLDEIVRFISDEVLWDESSDPLDPDSELLSGVLDSFGLQSLVSFLDERFGVTVAIDELVNEHFHSPRAIESLVRSKQGASG